MLTSVDAQTQPSRFYLTFMFENLSDINSYCKLSQCLHTGFTHRDLQAVLIHIHTVTYV